MYVLWNNKCRCWITAILYKYVCIIKHQAQNISSTSSYNTSGNKDTGSRTCQTNLSDGSSHRLGTLWSCWTGTWTGLGFERSHTLWHTLCQDELFTQLDVRASFGCHSALKSPEEVMCREWKGKRAKMQGWNGLHVIKKPQVNGSKKEGTMIPVQINMDVKGRRGKTGQK